MFDDWARIWVAVSDSVGCGSASWKVEPSSSIWSGTVKTELGLVRPSCRAAENVTSLKTEPGSEGGATGGLLGASLTASLAPRGTTPAAGVARAAAPGTALGW